MSSSIQQKPIAVVGLSGIFPEALSVRNFWNNVLNKINCIKEMDNGLKGYWNVDDYFDPDPDMPDKTYSKKAGFLPEIEFDPMEFGIPPINIEAVSTAQLFSLFIAKQAFKDAGILKYSNRDKIGVILGAGEAGNTAFYLAMRTEYPKWKIVLKNNGLSDAASSGIAEKFKNLYPGWQENSMPGFLGNVTSGRITNYFNLSGSNYTLNAACATSLAAVKAAMSELSDGSCDVVLTGGVGIDNSIMAFMSFTKTPVISISGNSRPYDALADGMILSDAVGMLVLKRLKDAQKDGDTIYAVIKGIGSSSDGKSDSIYAPSVEGQSLAMRRAYERAGCSPSTIRLVEGHGTATVAGDLTEFQSISNVFGQANSPKQSVALGSVKSQIGHGRVAAGASSLIKTVMALHHKILPPTINVDKPNPKFDIGNSPFYLNTEARPWFKSTQGTPRRAAVSSFGFGGTNFHIVLEEYKKKEEKAYRLSGVPEMIIVYAADRKALIDKCKTLLAKFSSDLGVTHYQNFLHKIRNISIPEQLPRIGFVAKSLTQALELLTVTVGYLERNREHYWEHPKGIFYRSRAADIEGRVVALFPGQGSQYLNMCSGLVQNYPILRHMVEDIDEALHTKNLPKISEIMYPPPAFSKEIQQQQENKLIKSENAQPAIGAISAGLYELIKNAGFSPDFAIGHSFGELTALWAAGAIKKKDFIELEIERGRAMTKCGDPGSDSGSMLALSATEDMVSELISSTDDLTIANYNSPDQFVIAGSTASVNTLQQDLKSVDGRAKRLPVSAAFHSPFVGPARDYFTKVLKRTKFYPAHIPVFANKTGDIYPKSQDEMMDTLARQITSPVYFHQAISSVHKKGGYLFVEIGPGSILTNLTKRILKGKDHIAIALNPGRSKEDEFEFRKAIVRLRVTGLPLGDIDPYRLWEPDEKEEKKTKKKLSITLNGGLYLNPKTAELRNKALCEKDMLAFEDVVEPKIKLGTNQKGEQLEMLDNNESNTHTQNNYTDSQESTQPPLDGPSQMHMLYQKNQEKYLDLFKQMLQFQNNLMEKFHDSPHLPLLLEHFGNTHQLLEANQPYYHTVHGEYIRACQPSHPSDSDRALVTPELGTRQEKSMALELPDSRTSPRPVLLTTSTNSTDQSDEPDETPGAADTQPFLDPNKIVQRIIESVSDGTGRPISQIDPDADLEIDLGIDMMKAIEILTVIHEEFHLDSALLEKMIEFRTINEIGAFLKQVPQGLNSESDLEKIPQDQEASADSVDRTSSGANNQGLMGVVISSGATPSPATSPLSPSPATLKDPSLPEPPHRESSDSAVQDALSQDASEAIQTDGLTEQVLEIISDKTGYPTDMLETDMDLSADLGVDSIKIVQILGEIQEQFPHIEVMDPEELEKLELRTIGQVADYINSLSENPILKKNTISPVS